MAELPARPLILLTDRTLLTPNWTLAQAVAPCITGGVNAVVLRESELPDNPRLAVARFVKDCVANRVPFIVSGAPQFAIQAGADGLLIEDQNAAVAGARDQLGPDRILGAVTSSLRSLDAAQSGGADFVLVPLDWTDPQRDLNVLQQFCQVSAIPVIAGVDMEVAIVAACIESGAKGIAICSVCMASYDRTGAVRKYAASLSLSGRGLG